MEGSTMIRIIRQKRKKLQKVLAVFLALIAVAGLMPAAGVSAAETEIGPGTILENGKYVYEITWYNEEKGIYEVSLRGLTKSGITSAYIPETVCLEGIDFKVTRIEARSFLGQQNLKRVFIGPNVRMVANVAFKNCVNLESVTGGKSVSTIGKYAFCGCSSLKSMSLGPRVTTIREMAFGRCTSLEKITLPASTAKVVRRAFYNCKNLKTLVIRSERLTAGTVGTEAFAGLHSKAVVKVPKAKLAYYKRLLTSRGITGKNQIIKGF